MKKNLTWLRNLPEPLRVVAHTQVQFKVFLDSHGLPPSAARLLRDEEQLYGVHPSLPLILLPGWHLSRSGKAIVDMWRGPKRGSTLEISEENVLGKSHLCPNDTNGDGNCHLCERKCGCRWPDQK